MRLGEDLGEKTIFEKQKLELLQAKPKEK